MRKYRPVTVFIGTHQADTLRVLAEKTREVKNPAQVAHSQSSLVRVALTRFIQELEEWDDAVKYAQTHHHPMPKQPKPNLFSLAARVAEEHSLHTVKADGCPLCDPDQYDADAV